MSKRKRLKKKKLKQQEVATVMVPLTGENSHFPPLMVLILVTLVFLIPFAGKAFNIDEPLFLWAAKHIQSNPLDPYGFSVNWYGTEMPMYDVTKNPPLACYYITLASLLLGWSETGLHMAFLIPTVAVVIGTYFIALSLCKRPLMASLATIATPVFIVSSVTVMCDIMMLAFWVWAVFFWIRGINGNDHRYLAISGILVTAAALTKYYGISLIPLLVVYGLLKERRMGWWLAYFLIPIITLSAYQWATANVYGRGLLLDAGSYAMENRKLNGAELLVGLVFTGGCFSVVFFYIVQVWTRKVLATEAVVFILMIFALQFPSVLSKFHNPQAPARDAWQMGLQLGAMAFVGLNVLVLCVADLLHRKDADSIMIALWIGGTFVFAAFFNWTMNGRSVLPMAPAMGILLMRAIDRKNKRPRPGLTLAIAWPLIPALALAVLVMFADFKFSNASRYAATRVFAEFRKSSATVWFQGHWGAQYYLESIGAKPIDFMHSRLLVGDMMIVPKNNTNLLNLPSELITHMADIEIPVVPWLATMNPWVGAGFYSTIWGPLPYAVGKVPPELYQVYTIELKVQ